MDDDDLRRGRPSCHRQYGEAIAILAGDALNTYAFEVVVRTAPDPVRVPGLVLSLCTAAGTGGMVGGQVADLTSEGAAPTLERVRSIHERKTAALIGCALELGALAVGADTDLVARLGLCGRELGLAFQIVDDVLDEEGLVADLGKTPGKDRQRGKLTYPAAVGLQRARADAEEIVARAVSRVTDLPAAELLSGLGDVMLARRT
jgi:geranylgeranyl pyrophosphate synthase